MVLWYHVQETGSHLIGSGLFTNRPIIFGTVDDYEPDIGDAMIRKIEQNQTNLNLEKVN
jgi:hypothetical protein